jgi:hypothetical protein
MDPQDLFWRLVDLDLLGLTADKRKDRALALAPHPADQRNVDVIDLGCSEARGLSSTHGSDGPLLWDASP